MHFTGSTRAKEILDNWADYRPKFRKVMPVDFKRVLTVMKESEAAGLSEEETVAKVMEAAK